MSHDNGVFGLALVKLLTRPNSVEAKAAAIRVAEFININILVHTKKGSR